MSLIKTPTPGAKKVGPSGQKECVDPRGSPGGRSGDGQAWNCLIHNTVCQFTEKCSISYVSLGDSVTPANCQIKWGQSTNFNRIQDDAWLKWKTCLEPNIMIRFHSCIFQISSYICFRTSSIRYIERKNWFPESHKNRKQTVCKHVSLKLSTFILVVL